MSRAGHPTCPHARISSSFRSQSCRCHQCPGAWLVRQRNPMEVLRSGFVCGFNLRCLHAEGNTLTKPVSSISCGCPVSAMAGRPRTEWTHFSLFPPQPKKKKKKKTLSIVLPRAPRATRHAHRSPARSCGPATNRLMSDTDCIQQLRRTVLHTYRASYLAKNPQRSHSVISR